jgi:hypothetical protein
MILMNQIYLLIAVESLSFLLMEPRMVFYNLFALSVTTVVSKTVAIILNVDLL